MKNIKTDEDWYKNWSKSVMKLKLKPIKKKNPQEVDFTELIDSFSYMAEKEPFIMKKTIEPKPDVYHAYEDEYDGGSEIGYFWNELDAFIACLKWHKKDLDEIPLCIQQEKEKGYTELWEGYWKGHKRSKIKRLKKLRIKRIDIK